MSSLNKKFPRLLPPDLHSTPAGSRLAVEIGLEEMRQIGAGEGK